MPSQPKRDQSEVEVYDQRVSEIVSAARTAFLANRAKKSGWMEIGWDPLEGARKELVEVEEARSQGHHVFELGDTLNFLAFERQHELSRRGLL